jgi:hypothetical protein
LSEISSDYLKNLDKNFFGNGATIFGEENFNNWIENFSGSDILYYIVRTNLSDINLITFSSSIFGRIYKIEVVPVKGRGKKMPDLETTLRSYEIIFNFLKPQFWSDFEKDAINFYSLHLLKFLDWELCLKDETILRGHFNRETDTFESYFRCVLVNRTEQLNFCDLFFHHGILNYLKSILSKKMHKKYNILTNSIAEDFLGINRIMRTPYKLKNAISYCEYIDQTHISEQLIKEYRRMRKSW